MIQIYTDGATLGWNGPLGTVKKVGLGIYIPEINIKEKFLVNGISNNEAEFKALINGMQIALENNIYEAKFLCDNTIIVNRANGKKPKKAKYKNERMDKFQSNVLDLAKEFNKIIFKWIPREENQIADELSKLALKLK